MLGTWRPADNRAHCACCWPLARQGCWACSASYFLGPPRWGCPWLVAPASVLVCLHCGGWACADPVTHESGVPYCPSFDGSLGQYPRTVSCGRGRLHFWVGGQHARVRFGARRLPSNCLVLLLCSAPSALGLPFSCPFVCLLAFLQRARFAAPLSRAFSGLGPRVSWALTLCGFRPPLFFPAAVSALRLRLLGMLSVLPCLALCVPLCRPPLFFVFALGFVPLCRLRFISLSFFFSVSVGGCPLFRFILLSAPPSASPVLLLFLSSVSPCVVSACCLFLFLCQGSSSAFVLCRACLPYRAVLRAVPFGGVWSHVVVRRVVVLVLPPPPPGRGIFRLWCAWSWPLRWFFFCVLLFLVVPCTACDVVRCMVCVLPCWRAAVRWFVVSSSFLVSSVVACCAVCFFCDACVPCCLSEMLHFLPWC